MRKTTRNSNSKVSTLFRLVCIPLFAVLILSTGCRTRGPKTVTQDRFLYGNALGNSWKSMLLINIVKTRYLDLPVFLDVEQIVSAYSVEKAGSLNGGITGPGGIGNIGIAGAASYTESPTITYTPMMGNDFLESFLTPINPVKICSLIEAGYAPDRVMKMAIASLNGLNNLPVIILSHDNGESSFFKTLSLLNDLFEANAAGFRMTNEGTEKSQPVFYIVKDDITPDIQSKMDEVYKLLKLNPQKSEFPVIFSASKGNGEELCMKTRSMKQILQALSLGVQIPSDHIAKNLSPPLNIEIDPSMQIIQIKSGLKEPTDAFVAVPYEGAWFWIDYQDHMSKDKFTFILFLFTLIDKGSAMNMPTLTIPTR